MVLRTKFCEKCGVPIDAGLAACPNCGARTGTVFSETSATPYSVSPKQRIAEHISTHHTIERAKHQANQSVIFALVSFLPVVGLFSGPAAIYLGLKAIKVLRSHQVEEGRGIAAAGLVIGLLSVLAQLSYAVLFVSAGPGGPSVF